VVAVVVVEEIRRIERGGSRERETKLQKGKAVRKKRRKIVCGTKTTIITSRF